MIFIGICASTRKDGIIGTADNKLPGSIEKEIKLFKKITKGCPIIMGRKTFDSIGFPLPDRRNIILTRNRIKKTKGVEYCYSVADVIKKVKDEDKVFIIGGKEIFYLFKDYIDFGFISGISGNYQGIVKINGKDLMADSFEIVEKKQYDKFAHYVYRRRKHEKNNT